MNFNPRKLFVIVGYPHTGKTKTLAEIFGRRLFFPFKGPIQASGLGTGDYIVINNSDHNYRAGDYLARIKSVIEHHRDTEACLLVVVSLVFDDSARDVRTILSFFSELCFEMHYLMLYSSWNDKKVISDADMELFRQEVKSSNIYVLDRLITQSRQRFKERVEEIVQLLRELSLPASKSRGFFANREEV
jgi:hypothetical protein